MDDQGSVYPAFHDGFEQLLRDSAPDIRPSDRHRANLRLILDHNFRHHRRRQRGVIATLVLALAILGTTQIADLVSTDFEMIQLGIDADGEAVVVSAGGYGQATPDDMEPMLSQEDLEYLAIRYEKIAAKDYEILEFRGWTIGGGSFFSVMFNVETDGEVETLNHLIGNPEKDTIMKMVPFLTEYEAHFLELVENGKATELGQTILRVEDHKVLFTRWMHTYPDYGEVVYWKGVPLE